MEVKELTLRTAGMFSNVNEVIQQLYLAEQGGYQFVIDWHASCYKETNRKSDPWNYYFEDCYPELAIEGKILRHLANGPQIACSKENIITPREVDGKFDSLLLPRDRKLPNRLIKRHIKLRPCLMSRISNLVKNLFSGHVIGLHIRGPGRLDGGTLRARSNFVCKFGVPFQQYFKFVDKCLLGYPESAIFACSDSLLVMQEVVRRYGSKVVSYAATRSDFGEMHTGTHPENAGQVFPKYKLGEDVIIEAYMLSQTDFFVHGSSNLANFVLCNEPLLPSVYVYGH